MNKTEKLAKTHKFTLTSLREDVIRIFLEKETPLKAYDVLAYLKKSRPNAKPPTVYRVLDFLVKHKVLHRLDTSSSYSLCQISEETQCCDNNIEVMFVCRKCSKVKEFSNHDIGKMLKEIEDKNNLQIDKRQVEVSGICEYCK